MKCWGRTALLAPLLVLVLASGVWGAMAKAELINGTQWTKWTEQDKLVYIRGISNWADFVTAAQTQVKSGKPYEFCISKAFVDQLKHKSLGQVAADVDAYYQANPGEMHTSVIEVILRRSTTICPPETSAKEKKK
jgi:phage tail protein X